MQTGVRVQSGERHLAINSMEGNFGTLRALLRDAVCAK